MNKYQDALNKIVKSSCPNCIDENGCSTCDIEKICNATAKSWVNRLQELIDKETPIKTTSAETEPGAYYGVCESCGSGIRLCQHYDNEKEKWIKECYCPYCGQKLYFGE